MARDAVTVTALALNAVTNTPAGTTISTTNGAVITPGGAARKLLIRITNTITNATKTATIKAGVNPPALQQAVGDLALVVPQSGDVLVTLESARFMQADGTINVDFSTGMTGKIDAWRLPNTL